MRLHVVCSLLLLTGCAAPVETPTSICDLPNLRTWTGVTVEWSGVVQGTFQHGFGLVAEDCSRMIPLDGWYDAPGGDALTRALEQSQLQPGLLRADVSGKIIGEGDRGRLWVTRVHRLRFQRMTEDQYYEYWDRRAQEE